jgi:flavin reductase (DIM6/NTAB) family NADH-FMN oxidoreductase RutF
VTVGRDGDAGPDGTRRAVRVPGERAAGVPGDVDDRMRRRVLWAMPTGLYVVGSTDGEQDNLMTANLVVQVATDPKLVAVALDVTSVTLGLVREGGCFALSLLAREDRAVVRRFVKPVPAATVVRSGGAPVEMAGEPVEVHVTGAPVLARAVAWLDCEVRHRLVLGSHELVIGEVVAVGGPSGDPPPVLRMEDTRMNYGG